MAATEPQPICRSQLPPTPPPEWDHHTWFPTPDGDGDLVPGQHGRGVLIRRRVTWGDWEPVHPEHWAAETEGDATASRPVANTPADLREPDNPAAAALAQHIADHEMSTIQAAFRILGMQMAFEVRDADETPLARLRARLVADRDRAARNARHAHTEQVQLVGDGIVAGLDTAIRWLDDALAEVDRSCGKPRAGGPAQPADRP